MTANPNPRQHPWALIAACPMQRLYTFKYFGK